MQSGWLHDTTTMEEAVVAESSKNLGLSSALFSRLWGIKDNVLLWVDQLVLHTAITGM